MKGNFVVHQVEERREPYFISEAGVFQVREDRPAVWLQRVCAWVLGRLGAVYMEERCRVTTHLVQPMRLLEAISRQRAEVFEHLGREGSSIAIGGEDYAELMRDPELRSLHFFEFTTECRSAGRVFGLRIQIIPWMKGIVVLP